MSRSRSNPRGGIYVSVFVRSSALPLRRATNRGLRAATQSSIAMANYTTEARASFQTGISSRSCSLAILPENLQSYVFTLAGLATGKWIDLAENSPQQDFPRQEHWVNEVELKTTSSLLSIRNRVLQAQISRSVYSGNHFFIDYHSQQGLDALLRLGPCTLKSLRSLVCYLNVSKGYSLNSCCWHRWKLGYQKRKAEFPSVLSDGAAAKSLISCWEQVCDLLGQYIPSGMLELSVICDVDGPDLAQAIADPIVRRLPQLKNLRISFSPKRREDLAHVAHVTWLQATRTPVPSDPPPFRFFELPREIRTEILKCTELVLPLKEVHWSPQTKYDFLLGPHVGVGMSDDPGSVPYWKPCLIGETSRRICQLLYSAYDVDCDCLNRCWRSPRNLFLVSKAFYAEAKGLFLQENRFIITPEKQWLIGTDTSTPEHTNSCLFLRHTLRRTALASLRFLEIVFHLLKDMNICNSQNRATRNG